MYSEIIRSHESRKAKESKRRGDTKLFTVVLLMKNRVENFAVIFEEDTKKSS